MTNRPIKFRAWDIETKRMHSWDELRTTEITLGRFFARKDFERMQFTGLTDKNGKDVYEGDILQDVETPAWKYEVVWGKYGWEMKALWNGWHVPMFRHGSEGSYEYEIIGNIYENKDLLS